MNMMKSLSPSWVVGEVVRGLVQHGTNGGSNISGIRVNYLAEDDMTLPLTPYYDGTNGDEPLDVTLRKMVTVSGGFLQLNVYLDSLKDDEDADLSRNKVRPSNPLGMNSSDEELLRGCLYKTEDGNPAILLVGNIPA